VENVRLPEIVRRAGAARRLLLLLQTRQAYSSLSGRGAGGRCVHLITLSASKAFFGRKNALEGDSGASLCKEAGGRGVQDCMLGACTGYGMNSISCTCGGSYDVLPLAFCLIGIQHSACSTLRGTGWLRLPLNLRWRVHSLNNATWANSYAWRIVLPWWHLLASVTSGVNSWRHGTGRALLYAARVVPLNSPLLRPGAGAARRTKTQAAHPRLWR